MRLMFILVIGLGGAAVLAALGVWQLQRLEWKQGILAGIEARTAAEPAPIPPAPSRGTDRYLPVTASGAFVGPEIHRLDQVRGIGPGYRVIQAFRTGGRLVLVDRGFVPEAAKDAPRPPGPARITGNLDWPNERDWFTPERDIGRNIWFERDVDALAETLGTEAVLVVLSGISGDDGRILPRPVTTVGIPNNHLQYAVTWFGLAAVWIAMTVFWARRRGRAR